MAGSLGCRPRGALVTPGVARCWVAAGKLAGARQDRAAAACAAKLLVLALHHNTKQGINPESHDVSLTPVWHSKAGYRSVTLSAARRAYDLTIPGLRRRC